MLDPNPDTRISFDELLGSKIKQYIDYLKDGRDQELARIASEHKHNIEEDDDLKLSLIREKISFKINAARKSSKNDLQNLLEICNRILTERNKAVFLQRIA